MSTASDQEVIRQGSQSFYLASRLFKVEERNAAWKLYRWCRFCDDALDGQDLGHVPKGLVVHDSEDAFHMVLRETEQALAHKHSREETRGLAEILEHYRIPKHYVREMLRGMQMDQCGVKMHSFQDLLDYCYCVASTVGLMMCSILGLNDEDGLAAAHDLGIAMQLTNIVRDIKTDLDIKRVYIPEAWLERFFLPKDGNPALMRRCFQEQPHLFKPLVKALVERADAYYSSGLRGLRYLNLRAAWAVASAALVYRAIGHKRLKNDPQFLKKRVYVSQGEKILWVIFAFFRFVLPLAVGRIFSPWRAMTVSRVFLSPYVGSLKPVSDVLEPTKTPD